MTNGIPNVVFGSLYSLASGQEITLVLPASGQASGTPVPQGTLATGSIWACHPATAAGCTAAANDETMATLSAKAA